MGKAAPPAAAAAAPVTLPKTAAGFTLANGILTVQIDAQSAAILSIEYKGVAMLGVGARENGYWSMPGTQMHFGPHPAVTVVDDVQRMGLGRLLATTLAEAARERGVHTFRADVLAVNEPMRSMMTEIGATEGATDSGVISYDVSLDAVGHARGSPVARFLRAAAGSMAVLLRRLGPPPPDT